MGAGIGPGSGPSVTPHGGLAPLPPQGTPQADPRPCGLPWCYKLQGTAPEESECVCIVPDNRGTVKPNPRNNNEKNNKAITNVVLGTTAQGDTEAAAAATTTTAFNSRSGDSRIPEPQPIRAEHRLRQQPLLTARQKTPAPHRQ